MGDNRKMASKQSSDAEVEFERLCARHEIIHRSLGRNELISSILTPSGGVTWVLSLKGASRGSVELRNPFRLGSVVLVIEGGYS